MRAHLRTIVKRILRKHGLWPPDGAGAAQVLSAGWTRESLSRGEGPLS